MTVAAHALPEGYVRETAEGVSTSTSTATRTFTEGEAYALVADNVQRETAALTSKNDGLTREVADLQAKLDVAEAAKSAADTARETAEKALEDFKAETVAEREQAARRETRVAKVREVAGHLKDEFFTDERAVRWAAMDDEAFASYCTELAELAPPKPEGAATTGATAPRETAMAGTQVTGDAGKSKGLSALAGFYPTSASKGV